MNHTVELNLALILFLPWYSILAWVYWYYPRQPRTRARVIFDVLSLAIAISASVAAMHWGFRNATRTFDSLWPQVLASTVCYGAFLAVAVVAWFVRRAWIAASADRSSVTHEVPK